MRANCVASTQRPHTSQPAPRRASYARLLTRQKASAFNQALSFDISGVTKMKYMFYVHSARALSPPALSRALPVDAPCIAATPNALTPPGP